MDWLVDFLSGFGYWGMAIGAFIAGSVLPMASEVLLVLFLGMGLNPILLLISATVGNTIGGFSCYYMARLAKREWVERFFHVSPRQMARADRVVQKVGVWAAFLSFVPLLGTAILLMLGFMRVNPLKISATMTAGKLLRYLIVLLSYTGVVELFSK
jgi:membrane protein YqaA with SNARE-associated domain